VTICNFPSHATALHTSSTFSLVLVMMMSPVSTLASGAAVFGATKEMVSVAQMP
jgi:hypothetical protein